MGRRGKRSREEHEDTPAYACPLCLAAIDTPVVLHAVTQGSTENVCLCCSTCAQDLRLLHSNARGLQCPQCGSSMTLDAEGGSFLPFVGGNRHGRASIVINAEINLSVDAPDTVCGFCEDAEGTIECAVCCLPLCPSCKDGPHSRGKLRHHRLVPLGSVSRHGSQMCERHDDQRLDLYCSTCRCSACVMCTFGGEHKGHDVVPLIDVVATARSSLKGDIERCETLQKCVSVVSSAWGAILPSVEERCTTVGDAVEAAFAELTLLVQQRKDELLQKVKSFQDTVKKDVNEKQAWLDALSRCAGRIHQSAIKLQSASPITTVDLQGQLGMSTERYSSLLPSFHGDAADWVRRAVPDPQLLHFEATLVQQLKDELRRAGGVIIPPVHAPTAPDPPQRVPPPLPRTSGLSLRISTQLPTEAPAMVQAVSRRKQILQVRTEEHVPRASAQGLNGLFRPPVDSKLHLKT